MLWCPTESPDRPQLDSCRVNANADLILPQPSESIPDAFV